MPIDIKLLKAICAEPGTSGFERRIRNLVVKQVKPYADSVEIDAMGNVIALKKGKTDDRLMITAHMDEIGFIVTHIDDKGFIRIHTLGGFDPKTLTAQRVIVHGKKDVLGVMGCKPIHVMTAEERRKSLTIPDYFIDTGMTKKELSKYVSVGDSVTRVNDLVEMGDCLNSKSLDNRVSVYIAIEALKNLKKKPPCDTYFTFTVQEEVGIRGAWVSGHRINPKFVINVDTTIAFDTPGSKAEEQITRLGQGTAIKIMDGRTLCDYRMIEYMKQTAKKARITWQPEILPKGGTDTSAVQLMGQDGVIAGALSIPTRNVHQSVEMVHKEDVQGTIDLLLELVRKMDKYDWAHN